METKDDQDTFPLDPPSDSSYDERCETETLMLPDMIRSKDHLQSWFAEKQVYFKKHTKTQ